jgi:hypothetical protein
MDIFLPFQSDTISVVEDSSIPKMLASYEFSGKPGMSFGVPRSLTDIENVAKLNPGKILHRISMHPDNFAVLAPTLLNYQFGSKANYPAASVPLPTPKFQVGDDVVFIGTNKHCPVGQIGRVGSVVPLNSANIYYFDAGPTAPGMSLWCAEADLTPTPRSNSAPLPFPTLVSSMKPPYVIVPSRSVIIEDLVNSPKVAAKGCQCDIRNLMSVGHDAGCPDKRR